MEALAGFLIFLVLSPETPEIGLAEVHPALVGKKT
jgi:hypothetical protein